MGPHKFEEEHIEHAMHAWATMYAWVKKIYSLSNAPTNVKPAEGEAGHGVGIWLFLLAQV